MGKKDNIEIENSNCRQRKFSQPVNQDKDGRKSPPETTTANSRLVLITKEEE